MSSVCEELHKFQLLQPSHQLLSLKKSLRDIDIPPRKLLTRRSSSSSSSAAHDGAADMFSDETLLLHKYLPRNKTTEYSDDDDDDNNDPYSSDHFRMYEFKVRRCTRSRSHDWTDCPFAHPGEKARRRDPRRYHYSGTVCPEYRRDGACRRGDACEFSHGVFECWLHPARYRTEACKDGKSCKRKVCFFAHTPRQLRVLPLNLNNPHVPQNDAVSCCSNNHSKKSKFFNNHKGSGSNSNSSHFCLFCHCCNCSSSNSNFSPTSTLFGASHFSSPPMSPSSPASIGGVNNRRRYGGGGGGVNVSYKDVLTEIMCSIEGLNFGEASSPSPVSSSSKAQQQQNNHNNNNNNVMANWLHDVCCEEQCVVSSSFGCEDRKQHFNNILSPSFSTGYSMSGKHLGEDDEINKVVVDDVIGSSCPTPDLGWVNDLLM